MQGDRFFDIHKHIANSSRLMQKLALTLLLAFLLPALAACGNPAIASGASAGAIPGEAATAAIRFTDDTGATVAMPQAPRRVVALMGSYAETWLLAGGRLVGVTSDAQSERNLQLDPDVTVVGSVKEPSFEQLLALSPDFVILSTDIEGHRKLGPQLSALAIPHAYFQVEHFDDYLDMLRIFTDLTGNQAFYEQNGLAVQRRIQAIRSQAGALAGQTKVLLIRAFSGGAKARKADTMAGRMLAELGCDNIADRHASLLDEMSLEAVIVEDPDFIFVITMGESTEKALAGLRDGVQRNPAWSRLSAVRNGRYVVLPKELFHYKPNVRWDEAYAELARLLGRPGPASPAEAK